MEALLDVEGFLISWLGEVTWSRAFPLLPCLGKGQRNLPLHPQSYSPAFTPPGSALLFCPGEVLGLSCHCCSWGGAGPAPPFSSPRGPCSCLREVARDDRWAYFSHSCQHSRRVHSSALMPFRPIPTGSALLCCLGVGQGLLSQVLPVRNSVNSPTFMTSGPARGRGGGRSTLPSSTLP